MSAMKEETMDGILSFRMSRIGKNVKRIRVSKGMKQADLAYHANLTTYVVSMIENKKGCNPKLLTLLKIAYVLNVPLSEIIAT
jgi:transcriptional regulator with XRE-family HTH domain